MQLTLGKIEELLFRRSPRRMSRLTDGALRRGCMVLAVSGIAACGAGPVVTTHVSYDRAQVERDISTTFAAQLGEPIGPVTCPAHPTITGGEGFSCDSTFGASALVIKATPRGDKLAYQLSGGGTFVDNSRVAQDIEQAAAKNNIAGKADCGRGRWRYSTVHSTFDCSFTESSGAKHVAKATVTDAEGGVDFSIAQ